LHLQRLATVGMWLNSRSIFHREQEAGGKQPIGASDTIARLEKYPTKVQPGSTGILITNHLLHHALHPGNDPMGLGHWCWAQLQGQANQKTQIISMYWPCKLNSPTTTY